MNNVPWNKWYYIYHYSKKLSHLCETCLNGPGGAHYPECQFFKTERLHFVGDSRNPVNANFRIGYAPCCICIVFRCLGERPEYAVPACSFYELDPKADYRLYMKSPAWREKRAKKLREVGFQCELCGSAVNLAVHHITYAHLKNEPLDDLVVLCGQCHKSLHKKDLKDKEAAQ